MQRSWWEPSHNWGDARSKRESGEGEVEGGQGLGLQGSTGYGKDSIFVLRKTGRNGRILSKGVASDLPPQRLTLAAGWDGDGWAAAG